MAETAEEVVLPNEVDRVDETEMEDADEIKVEVVEELELAVLLESEVVIEVLDVLVVELALEDVPSAVPHRTVPGGRAGIELPIKKASEPSVPSWADPSTPHEFP